MMLMMDFVHETNIPNNDINGFVIPQDGSFICSSNSSNVFSIRPIFDLSKRTFYPTPEASYYIIQCLNNVSPYSSMICFEYDKSFLGFYVYVGGYVYDTSFGLRKQPAWSQHLGIDSRGLTGIGNNTSQIIFYHLGNFILPTILFQNLSIGKLTNVLGCNIVSSALAVYNGNIATEYDINPDIEGFGPIISGNLTGSTNYQIDGESGMCLFPKNDSVTLVDVNGTLTFVTPFNPQPHLLIPGLVSSLSTAIGLGVYPHERNSAQNGSSPTYDLFWRGGNVHGLFNGPNGFLDLYSGDLNRIMGFVKRPLVMNNHTMGAKYVK